MPLGLLIGLLDYKLVVVGLILCPICWYAHEGLPPLGK